MKWDFRLWLFHLLPAIFIAAFLTVAFTLQNDTIIAMLSCHTRNWDMWYTAFSGPFLHGDWLHLTGNLFSFIGLSGLFVLLFPRDWWRFFILQWAVSSILLFVLGDLGEQHIGASTWLYAFASFLSLHVLRSKEKRMKALFLVIVLWYGSMWWGLLPIVPGVSHEGHIAGLITGVLIGVLGMPYWDSRVLPEWHYKPKEWELESEPLNPYDSFKK